MIECYLSRTLHAINLRTAERIDEKDNVLLWALNKRQSISRASLNNVCKRASLCLGTPLLKACSPGCSNCSCAREICGSASPQHKGELGQGIHFWTAITSQSWASSKPIFFLLPGFNFKLCFNLPLNLEPYSGQHLRLLSTIRY